MDRAEAREYRWYLMGCERLGWPPVSGEEFVPQYKRYRRCSRAIQKYNRRSAVTRSFPVVGRFMTRLMSTVIRERNRLDFLSTAVSAGQGMDQREGGAGVAVLPTGPPPHLIDSAAKLHPALDPEPAWRNP